MFFFGLRQLSCHASISRVAMEILGEEPLNQVEFVVKYDTKWPCMGFKTVHELWKFSIPLMTHSRLTATALQSSWGAGEMPI
jgi:hypothetical protein